MLLNNQWITEEIKEEIKKMPRDKLKWKHNDSKSIEFSKSSSKRGDYSNTVLSQEIKKSQINNLILYLKQLDTEKQIRSKIFKGKKS